MQLRKYAAYSGTTGQAPADFSESSIQAELVRNANAEPSGFLMAPQTLMIFNGGGYGRSRVPAAAPAPVTPPVTRPGLR